MIDALIFIINGLGILGGLLVVLAVLGAAMRGWSGDGKRIVNPDPPPGPRPSPPPPPPMKVKCDE